MPAVSVNIGTAGIFFSAAKRPMVRIAYVFLLLVSLWSLAYEVHELVELRSDDNLCATVLVLTGSAVVVSNGVVLATSCCGEALWIYAKLCLESLYDT